MKCLVCGLFPFQPCCLASHSQHISGATILKVGQDESPRSSKTPEALSSLTVAFRVKQTPVHGLSSQHDLAPAHLFICHVATCSRPLVSVVPLNTKHLSSQECLCVLARFPSPTLKKESVLSSPVSPQLAWASRVGAGDIGDWTSPICGCSPPPLPVLGRV